MNIAFNVDMDGWTRELARMRSRARDLITPNIDIGDMLLAEMDATYENSGNEVTRWKPPLPSTLRQRHRKYPGSGDKPLIVTGELRRTMNKFVTSEYVEVGSPMPKSKPLFFGSDRIPARSPFKFSAFVMKAVGDIYVDYILGGKRRARRKAN